MTAAKRQSSFPPCAMCGVESSGWVQPADAPGVGMDEHGRVFLCSTHIDAPWRQAASRDQRERDRRATAALRPEQGTLL